MSFNIGDTVKTRKSMLDKVLIEKEYKNQTLFVHESFTTHVKISVCESQMRARVNNPIDSFTIPYNNSSLMSWDTLLTERV